MENSTPGILNLCCCFVFLAAVGGFALVRPGPRRAILRMLGREAVGDPLPPKLAQLSAAAMPGLHRAVIGMPEPELQLVSELVASIQLAQELLWPPCLDRAVGEGLRTDPDGMLAGFEHGLSQIQPRSREISRAIVTLKMLRGPRWRHTIAPTAIYFQNLAA